MRNHKTAVRCYKQMLALSWDLNQRDYEHKAYENLGVCHFYLGDIEKAKYYHDKAFKGIYESEKS